MSDLDKPDKNPTEGKSVQKTVESREQKLARQLRENLAKRKNQSRARNTKPRKFKKPTD